MTVVGKAVAAPLDQRAVDTLVTGDALDVEPALPQRQCGRCRRLFDGDPALHALAIPDWWLCAACRISLGVDRPGVSSTTC